MEKPFKITVDLSTFQDGVLLEKSRDEDLDGIVIIGVRMTSTGCKSRYQMVGQINTMALAETVHRLFEQMEKGPECLAITVLNRVVENKDSEQRNSLERVLDKLFK